MSIRRNSYFPSQVVSDAEKISYDYGLKVAKAIEQEWFDGGYNGRYNNGVNNFHNLRLYARGEQSIQKYKDELSINGDLSYLNLDWKPVPIIPKFVDIVVNGIAERLFSVKAYSQDPAGVSKRTEYMETLLKDMKMREFDAATKESLNIDLASTPPEQLPDSEDELQLHMQLSYKQAVELAEEAAITTLLDGSNYDLIKRRVFYDLTVIGIGATKTTFNTSEGAKVEYVDPANLVYSYTDSPYFEDIYYVGEVKQIPVNELVKEFPFLTPEDLQEITKNNKQYSHINRTLSDNDSNKISVLYFNYKTYMNEVYKMKETGSGSMKILPKDDTFNPPIEAEVNFTKLQRSIECLYEGALVLGTNKLLKWEMAKNMMRSKSDYTKVKMNYSIVAPRMYEGRIESLVSRVTGFADMIQLTHLKLQQVLSRMVPDGVYLDADGLAEIDLGNGTNYNPQEALNMFFQTGSIIGRSMTIDGDPNAGRTPIQEISNGSGAQAKMQSLIGTYNYYLQMIRDTTGLNEARDASTPDERSLVGVQKMAAANSNTATRHILNGGMFLTAEVCEQLSLRISDILEYSPTADAFIQAIGVHNVATLKEMSELHLYDFGIFLELAPDEEQKQLLENNIQTSIQQGAIDLEDAIDLRNIKNLKLANQMLKITRKKKAEQKQAQELEMTKAQGESQAQATQAAAQAEMQKAQQNHQMQVELIQAQAQAKSQHIAEQGQAKSAQMQEEAAIKKELMQMEFEINMKLQEMNMQEIDMKETMKEDRKDNRTRMQASQQSELIDQRLNKKPPKKFESSGNDIMSGELGLGEFGPK
tara:strand:+ start:33 stop:2474 length:2442 start_codon:yes stop_codon:yes gene_type:complete